MTNDAFFLKASSTNLFPLFFFPLIAKKISSFFISLELILACFKLSLVDIFLFSDNSLTILNFKLFDKIEFFILIEFKIFFYLKKKFSLLQDLEFFHDLCPQLVRFHLF